ncbi:hypothetical protein [Tardiphaga robiniae]|uniref:KAP NTPase domain-containing protein n=1 Tax=Tardiphaga robiniae TaxID=943830 RepID=A0A7G6TWZ3_9BRAD|nr:hypothetical protein [Tardiphaga robiniae]QND71275.1 hypothetical protein HB776_08510 [Tardiphaga robiniae]
MTGSTKLTPTEMVTKELGRFLADKRPEVICVKGRWGVGKTFAWKKALQDAAAGGQIALGTYSYVSLFGITTLEQLKYSIFENRTSGKAIATGANLESVSVGFSDIIKTVGPKTLEALGGKNLAEIAQASSFLMVRDQFICIDDIERKGKDLRAIDILGLVSMLAEQRNCKIVIIMNDEQLDEEKADFLKYQEKVIDRSLVYCPSPQESINIGLKDNKDFAQELGELCTRLNLSNIRVIKKIEKLVHQIWPVIKGYDPKIVKAHIKTMTVLGWAHYAEHGKPGEITSSESTVDFIMKRYGRALYGQTAEITLEEQRVEALLRMVEFEKADEADAVLNEGIKNGYFDEVDIAKYCDLSAEALNNSDAAAKWSAVWDRLHGSFDDDEKEFVVELMSAFEQNIKFISLSDLNHSVKILKQLSHEAEAKTLIKTFIDRRSTDPSFFNLSSNVFGSQIDDADVRHACNEKLIATAPKRPLHEILLEIYKNRGWNPADMEALVGASVDDYYEAFKMPLGDDHRRLVASALHFREFVNPDKEFLTVLEKAEEALRRIEKENALNAIRVGGLGIRPAPQSPPETLPIT